MPFLHIHTNTAHTTDDKQRISELATQMLAELTGKNQAYIMVIIETGKTIRFADKLTSSAYLEMKNLSLADEQTSQYSQQLCQFMNTHFNIPAERIFIEFSHPQRHMWGWNNKTFA